MIKSNVIINGLSEEIDWIWVKHSVELIELGKAESVESTDKMVTVSKNGNEIVVKIKEER